MAPFFNFGAIRKVSCFREEAAAALIELFRRLRIKSTIAPAREIK
jgi:hypothetical protein